MMAGLIYALCASAGAVFEVHSFPLSGPDAIVFLAQADRDRTADVFVAEGGGLTAYPSADGYAAVPVELPPGTTAFDVADLNGDGVDEVVAVCGDRIVECPITRDRARAAPKELFKLHTMLADLGGRPFPQVLTVREHGRTLLALPCGNTLEVRTPTGARVASYATGPDAPRRASYGQPFYAATYDPAVHGPKGSLDVFVSYVLDYEPDLPSNLLPIDTGPPAYRRGTPQQARDAASEDYTAWPWFPLTRAHENAPRVLYAESRTGDTLIRLMPSLPATPAHAEVKPGPVRKYPGSPVALGDSFPDFNGDGNADLLLWSAPAPGVSLDALTDALSGATWPIRLTVHLFSQEERCFEARPAARLECRLPVGWFLKQEGGCPLRNCVLKDFDGDGRTDVGFSTDNHSWSVWLSSKGFRGAPAQTVSFPDAIQGVAFQEDLAGEGRTSVGIRTAHSICLLYAK